MYFKYMQGQMYLTRWYLQFGGRGGKVFLSQASVTLDPSWAHISISPETQWASLGLVSIPGPPGRGVLHAHRGLPAFSFLPMSGRQSRPDFPTKLCLAFSPTRISSLSESQGGQASYNYLTCVKMCHYPHSSFERKRGHLCSLFLTNINDAGIGSKFVST